MQDTEAAQFASPPVSTNTEAPIHPFSPVRPIPNPLRAEMERRRLIAEKLLIRGYSRRYASDQLNVSYPLVRRWHLAMENPPKRKPKPTGGPQLLAELALHPDLRTKRPEVGPPQFLTRDQIREVWKSRTRWTGSSFSDAIFEVYGVRYAPGHSSHLLASLKTDAAKTNEAGA